MVWTRSWALPYLFVEGDLRRGGSPLTKILSVGQCDRGLVSRSAELHGSQ
jgi:hypothetical protein